MRSCHIVFNILLTCLIVHANEPIFSSQIHVQSVGSIPFSLHKEEHINMSIHAQVNDVCFIHRIHAEYCHQIMQYVFSYILPSVYHISLVNRGVDNDMARRMTKVLHYSDRYMELSCKDTTIMFDIISNGLGDLADVVVYNIGGGLHLAISTKYMQVSFLPLWHVLLPYVVTNLRYFRRLGQKPKLLYLTWWELTPLYTLMLICVTVMP